MEKRKAGYMLEELQQSAVFLAAIGTSEKVVTLNQSFCVATSNKNTGKVTNIYVTSDNMQASKKKLEIESAIKASNEAGTKNDSREIEVMSCAFNGDIIHL